MKAKHARIAIDAILRSIDEDDLPTPDRTEHKDGRTIVWFGGTGRYLGEATRGGTPDPDVRRRHGIIDAIEGEAIARLDEAHLKAVTK